MSNPVGTISDNSITGVKFFGTPSSGESVTVEGGVRTIITDNYFESGVINASAGTALVKRNVNATSLTLKGHEARVRTIGSVNSTSLNNQVFTDTITGGTLLIEDTIKIKVSGTVSGTNDAKNLRLLVGSTELAGFNLASADIGGFIIETEIYVRSSSINQRAFSTVNNGSSVEAANVNISENISNDYDLSLEAWVANSSDSVRVDLLEIDVDRLGY